MSLPVLRWLSRPLARFLRHTWMSRTLQWPAGLDGIAAFLSPRKKPAVKRDSRIALEALEQRFNPQDFLNVLKMGVSVGGIALISGQLPTPMSVALHGWDSGEPALPAAVPTAPADPRPEPAMPEPNPGQMEALASFDMNAAREQAEATSAPAEQPVSTTVEPAGQGGQADNSMQSWLDSVGAVLGSQPEQPSIVASAASSAPTNSGGGGGGESSGPASTLSTPPPAAPMSTSSANVPSADTAAQMTQPLATAGATTTIVPGTTMIVPSGGNTQTTVVPATPTQTASRPSAVAHPTLQPDYELTPLPFELNVGQSAPSVLALSHGSGFGFWLTDSSMVFSVPHHDPQTGRQTGSDVFTLQMVGANTQAQIVPGTQLPSFSNYFLGSDSGKWLPDVAQYESLSDQNVYPGIDLALQSTSLGSRDFEYDFDLQPGASLSEVQLSAQGLQSLSVNAQGQLVLGTSGGNVYMDSPVFQQTIDGRQTNVAGGYVLGPGDTIGFQVTGSYDATQPLVLDPSLNFATYLGGSGNDAGYAIAVDQNENSYITGNTTSTDFPTSNGFQSSLAGNSDLFVTKMLANGDEIAYSTYLGGDAETGLGGIGGMPADQAGKAIAVNAAGDAVVAGWTNAGDYPTTASAYDTTGVDDTPQAVVTELNATGDALDFSTYIGTVDSADGVAVDTSGVYVTGVAADGGTYSFPTTSGAFQSSFGSASTDAFVAKLDPGGDTLLYCTLLGGSSGGQGSVDGTSYAAEGAIAVDSSGDAYVTGQTTSSSFPTTSGVLQTSLSGSTDAFVTEVNPSGTNLVYSTYLGGNFTTEGHGIAVDVNGDAYVTGQTGSSTLPTTSGAYQKTNSGPTADAFVSELNPAGTTLVYSSYLGGTAGASAYGIAVDSNDQATVTGVTGSTSFPTTSGAFQTSFYGSTAAFVTRFTPTGTLSYSSFIGATSSMDLGSTSGYGVALDPRGDAYVTGATSASSLVGSSGGVQSSNAGGEDVFALEVLPDRPAAPVITGISPDTGSSSDDGITDSQNITIFGTGPANTTLTLELDGTGVLADNVPVSSGGTWSYDYSGTTLPAGSYDFGAYVTDGQGRNSDQFPFWIPIWGRHHGGPIIIEPPPPGPPLPPPPAAPEVYLSVPATTTSFTPDVSVTVGSNDTFPANAPVHIDVEMPGSSSYTMNYATGTLVNDYAEIQLPTLPSLGTYTLEARVTDVAGNQGTSSPETMQIIGTSGTWSGSTTVLTADPLDGDALLQLGNVGYSYPLDLDQSAGTDQGGDPALVYNSSEAAAYPIVQVTLMPRASSLPSLVYANLDFNGSSAGTVTYSTATVNQGDTVVMSLQSSTAGMVGLNAYTVTLQYGTGGPTQTFSGSEYIAGGTTYFDTDWSLSTIDQLMPVSGGVIKINGSGGAGFFAGTSSFTSPPDDNGTLTLAGGTYTYSTPDGTTETFNSSGYETKWTSADGLTSMVYSYSSLTHRLTGITAIDGAVTTISYGSSTITFDTVNGRVTTLTLSSGNLAGITNPDGGGASFTYDGHGDLTSVSQGQLQQSWLYTVAGVVGTYLWGSSTLNGETTYAPAILDGYGTTSGTNTPWTDFVYGAMTDPDNYTTWAEMDNEGRPMLVRDGNAQYWEYSYDTSGYLLSVTDPERETTSYSRDTDGYVTVETLPDGSTITYQYQTAHHALTKVTDEMGNSSTYAYDSGGHLTGSTDAAGNRSTYAYNSLGEMTAVTDANANTTDYSYDSDRRLTAVTDAMSKTTSIGYDANGNLHTVEDALGAFTTTNYDVMDRLTSTTNALGETTTYAYDPSSGLETSTTDAAGTKTVFGYDSRGLLYTEFDNVNGKPPQPSELYAYDGDGNLTSTRDADGNTTEMSYDGVGDLVAVTDANGNTTQYAYVNGQLLGVSTDAQGVETLYGLDSREFVTSTTEIGNGATSFSDLTSYNYDADGDLTSEVDPLTGTIAYGYDALGQETTVTDARGYTTTTTFDPVGNVSTVTDANGTTTSYSYNADNELTTITLLHGTVVLQTSTMAYDAVGDLTSSTDGAGHIMGYAYDSIGEETKVTDALGNITSYNYDAVGDVSSVVDSLGKVTTYLYNALHEQTGEINALNQQTTMVLDSDGNTVQTVDSLGNTTTYCLDGLGQTTGIDDAMGGVTTIMLYPDGDTHEVIDPDGNTTTYTEDSLERVTDIQQPSFALEQLYYDAANRVTTDVDADGRTINYTYDNDNDIAGEVWKNSSGVTVNVLTYTFDHDDNLLTAANNTGTETDTYNNLDEVQSYTNVFGQVLTYSYDGDDNVTLRTDSLGGTLTYAYDADNDLTSLQFSGTGATGTVVRVDFGYDARGEQTTITWYSNLAATSMVADSAYKYDSVGNLTAITNKDGTGTTLSYYDYQYDSADRVVTQTYWSQVGTATYTGTLGYHYDSTNQLTSVTNTGGSTATYSYDPNGNRNMTGYVTATGNEMTSDGTYTYAYDAEGNTTSKTTGSGGSQITWTYSYDNANELIGVVETQGGTTLTQITYSYDAEGDRVQQQVWTSGSGSTTTRFAIDPLDGGNTWMDMNGSNSPLVRYEFGPGESQIVTRTIASGTYVGVGIYFTDLQGSVRDIANWSGVLQDHIDYTSFGVPTESNAAAGDRYKFDGYQYEVTTRLYYDFARWYNPSTGNWLTEDPIGFAGGQANLTDYVGNDPTNEVDPSGLAGYADIPPPPKYDPKNPKASLDAMGEWWRQNCPKGVDPGKWLEGYGEFQRKKREQDRQQQREINERQGGVSAAPGSYQYYRNTKPEDLPTLNEFSRRLLVATFMPGGAADQTLLLVGGGKVYAKSLSPSTPGGKGPVFQAGSAPRSPATVRPSREFPANSITASEAAEIQAIATKYNTTIDVVGSRAAGKGRNIDTDFAVGKQVDGGPPTRSDIDFRIDVGHPQAFWIIDELEMVGNGAGTAGTKWSTNPATPGGRDTEPPVIRFEP